MLHNNMNIYRLMINDKHVKEDRARSTINEAKRATSFDGGSSKNRLEIQDKPRFNKRISSQVPSKFQKASDYRVSNP